MADKIEQTKRFISSAPEPPSVDGDESVGDNDLSGRLNPKQAALASAMIAGCTIKEAAEKVGYQYGAARQLAMKPHFKAVIAKANAEALEDSRRDIASLRGLSVRRARDILNDPFAPINVVKDVIVAVFDRTGLSPRSEVSAEVSVTRVASMSTEDLLSELRRSLLANGASEAEAEARVEAMRAGIGDDAGGD